MDRLYVVVRSDLEAGLQAAQACHAALEWSKGKPEIPENLVILNAPDERTVRALHGKTESLGAVLFVEPDLEGQATAFAVSGSARPMLSCLPLAMRKKSG
jgi:hypothetical protein